jgi:hypothetical protein
MRVYLLVILLCVVVAPAAFALEQTADDGGCGTIDPMSPCYMGSVQTYCTKPYGCPQCAFNSNTGAPVCFVLYGQPYGWCSCQPKGSATINGVKTAVCTVSGSCRTSR